MTPDFVEDLGQGIYAIDTGFQRPRFDAAYLMVENGRAAFIDTGTNHAVPRLLAALKALGLGADAVDWVIPTHVHLDHAGGAGLLMQACPNARLLVHPRGQRHLIDPRALWEGALAVYGEEEMQRSYGQLLPVEEARTLASSDEMRIDLGGRPLMLIDTPGHARHHHCLWDARSHSWFSGDTFGLSYREFDCALNGAWIMPSSTPVQFEPEPLRQSILRMLSYAPRQICLTHYSRVGQDGDLARLSALLLRQIDEMEDLALATPPSADRHEKLKAGLAEIYLHHLAAHGSGLSVAQQLELLHMDIELNAQGLGVWLDREAQAGLRKDSKA
ncbi:MBL fold metallo-hydrolase [Paucibacter sp. KCTC 42545]|uniref:MBL fold metallo-hydrolase n=1 Tax=Paucibacter sp. KCTC 42545 TaxID=1768242 RepID=UPI000733B2C4|nr:MBL fold metallo-hydrolase [Paucibacter sp. KCTC 42545]ALT76347.1 MBL fold metallo-hydrolase [Paucibacter sp. KCTC 42545]